MEVTLNQITSPTLFGSLVLQADRAVPNLDVVSSPHRLGTHVKGRYNGMWSEANSVDATEVYIPQRYKRLSITTTNPATADRLQQGLEAMDAQHGDARQLFKLGQLLGSIESDFAAVVNIAGSLQSETPVSGAFYLLSKGTPLYLALVFDAEEQTTQLVWSTLDFKAVIQGRGQHRYIFFPFPQVIDRPIFLHTQNLCSRWYRLRRDTKVGDSLLLLRAANALELALYKDPEIRTIK